jgi:hypothetical protein
MTCVPKISKKRQRSGPLVGASPAAAVAREPPGLKKADFVEKKRAIDHKKISNFSQLIVKISNSSFP